MCLEKPKAFCPDDGIAFSVCIWILQYLNLGAENQDVLKMLQTVFSCPNLSLVWWKLNHVKKNSFSKMRRKALYKLRGSALLFLKCVKRRNYTNLFFIVQSNYFMFLLRNQWINHKCYMCVNLARSSRKNK